MTTNQFHNPDVRRKYLNTYLYFTILQNTPYLALVLWFRLDQSKKKPSVDMRNRTEIYSQYIHTHEHDIDRSVNTLQVLLRSKAQCQKRVAICYRIQKHEYIQCKLTVRKGNRRYPQHLIELPLIFGYYKADISACGWAL